MLIARLKHAIQSRLGERGGIVHSVGTLVTGTAFAQAVAVLVLPLLTRLYAPAEFSVLAVYTSFLGILGVVACLRLDIAIPLPDRDDQAASLLVLALASSAGFSLLVASVLLLFHAQISALLRIPAFVPYLWLVPVGMLLAGTYSALQFWSTRKKKFSQIAATRMTQALGGAGIQAGTGWLGMGPLGLLFGQMFSGGAGVMALARDAWKHDKSVLSAVTRNSMRDALWKYSRFPKYSALEALANTAGAQIPVIMIAALALGPEAGFLMLATRLMTAPMSLIGGSIAQVYLAHAPEELRAGRLGDFTSRILSGLLKTGVGPLLFAGIVAGPVAGIVFGKEWARVGELVAWMTPWFVLQFLSSPVSMVMHVKGHQPQMLALTLAGSVLRMGALGMAYWFSWGHFSEIYVLSGAVFYGFCCMAFYSVAGVQLRRLAKEIGRALPIILAWSMAGGVFNYIWRLVI